MNEVPMRRTTTLSVLFGSVLFLRGCGRTPDDGPTVGDAVVPDSTRVLDAQTLAALQSVGADGSTFTFERRTAQLQRVQVGDILVSGIHEPLLPYGTLRRVEAIGDAGSAVVVTTTPASLAEAVESGSLQTTLDLGPGSVLAVTGGARLLSGSATQLVLEFNDVVLFDGDGDSTTTHDQVVLNGNIGLEPDLIIDIDIAGFSLQKATIELRSAATASLGLDAAQAAVLPQREFLIGTVPFAPVTIPLGPIPVVLVPVVELIAGIDGSVSARLSADLTLDAATTIGMGYDAGSFGPLFDVEADGDLQLPSFEDGAAASVRVWIGPRVAVTAYGIAGVEVDARFFARLDVDPSACPWWELTGGVEGQAGAFAEINAFDVQIDVFEWQTAPLVEEIPILAADGCAPSADAAQSEPLTWARTYGAESIEHPIAIAATPDGGAIMSGSTYSYTPGTLHVDAWLVKVDALGHVAWQYAFDDLLAGVAVAPIDGGYYLLAGEVSQLTEEPSVLMRLDLNGAVVWARALDATRPLDAAAMALLPDGSVAVAGNLGDSTDDAVWVARFAADGTRLWSFSADGPSTDQVRSMVVDPAGDLVVLARSESFNDLDEFDCYWVLKVDADGDLLWQNCYAGPHFEQAGAIVAANGGYYVFGDRSNDAQVDRIASDGALLWSRHLDGDTDFDNGYAAAALPGGDLAVAGRVGLGDDAEVWVFRLTDDGRFLWSRRYGGPLEDAGGGFNQYAPLASTIAPAADGGLFVAATTTSFGSGSHDVWLLKVRGTGAVELDAGSGAASAAQTSLSETASHRSIPTTVPWLPFELQVAETQVRRISTAVTVIRQGGLP